MAPDPRRNYPVELDVTDLMQTPDGMEQVGDEYRVTDPDVAPDLPAVVGQCERCGRDIRERTIGHTCKDGYRDHPDGEGICNLEDIEEADE